MAGMESLEMAYADDGRNHHVRIGSAVDMAVEDFVSPMDPTGQGVKISGIGFPADTLAAGTSSDDVAGAGAPHFDVS